MPSASRLRAHPATELARLAIEFIRQLNRDLAVPPMRQLVRAEDLALLGQKAEQNTSTPSNPRAADAAAFTAMFAREIGGSVQRQRLCDTGQDCAGA